MVLKAGQLNTAEMVNGWISILVLTDNSAE